jgi:phage baseplate assembly protein W
MSDAPPDLRADLAARFFGRGLQLTQVAPDSLGVDVVWAEGPSGRRLAMVAGGDNLGQDLRVALLTVTGSDVFNVAFGFDGMRVLTEGIEPVLVEEMLRLSVLKTVALDPRIRRVLDVRMAETEPGSRRWEVTVELQTVLGEVLNLVLGTVNGR